MGGDDHGHSLHPQRSRGRPDGSADAAEGQGAGATGGALRLHLQQCEPGRRGGSRHAAVPVLAGARGRDRRGVAYEASAGPHTAWFGNKKKLALRQDDGVDLNAFYDRQSISFFHQEVNGRTYFSGASTDVVAHEAGHGLLDSVRPDFFDVNFLEVGAFHEAFGDCIAILTALSDRESRQKLLAVAPNLRKRNFVESTAEELSKAIGLVAPGHNASVPRRAFNSFKYQLPSTLPSNGGPGALINEVHSFGMVFTGCFWDLIAKLFAASASKTEATLLTAAKLAGRLLIAGAKGAVVTPRFTQSVGRAMVLADQQLNGGANHLHIREAFALHNVMLGSNALMAPSMALAGAAPSRGRLSASASRDLRRRMGDVQGARLTTSATNFFGVPLVSAVQTRTVPLGSLHPSLKGVVAVAHEPVLVGASGARAAVMGVAPNPAETESEVHAFVESLLAHRRIRLGSRPARLGARRLVASDEHPAHASHVIKSVGGKKVLKRERFVCFCAGCGPGLRSR